MTVRTSSGLRKERARAYIRNDILLAAGEVFARRGYRAATLADVAQAAGFAAPSLYRYFSSKEEIYRNLITLLLHEILSTFLEPVDSSLPFGERLRVLLTSQMERTCQRREIFTFLVSNPAPEVQIELDGFNLASPHAGLAVFTKHFETWLRQHAAPGELRCVPEQAARVIAGVLHGFFEPSGKSETAQAARVIVDLVLHGVAPATSPDVQSGP